MNYLLFPIWKKMIKKSKQVKNANEGDQHAEQEGLKKEDDQKKKDAVSMKVESQEDGNLTRIIPKVEKHISKKEKHHHKKAEEMERKEDEKPFIIPEIKVPKLTLIEGNVKYLFFIIGKKA